MRTVDDLHTRFGGIRSRVPGALTLFALAAHGFVVLSLQPLQTAQPWQYAGVGLVLLLALYTLYRPLAPALAASLLTADTLFLMATSGGVSSFFLAWLFLINVFYSVRLGPPWGAAVAPLSALGYLLLLPVSGAALPVSIALSRALLLFAVGASVYALVRRLHSSLQRERALSSDVKASEERLQRFVDTLPGVTYIRTRDGGFHYVSPQLEELLRYPVQQFKTGPAAYGACIHPQDRAGTLQAFEHAFEHALPYKLDYRLLAKDGSVVWVQDHASPAPQEDGSVSAVHGVILNVTPYCERELAASAQLEFQAELLDNLHDAVIATDMDFRITNWNRGAEALYGYGLEDALGKNVGELLNTRFSAEDRERAKDVLRSKGEWQGQVIQTTRTGEALDILSLVSLTYGLGLIEQIIHPEDRAKARDSLAGLGKRQDQEVREYRIVRPSGDIRTVWVSTLLETDAAGTPLRLLGAVQDISDRKKIELALQDNLAFTERVLETSLDGYILSDSEGKILDANPAYCQLSGYTHAELTTMHLSDLDPNYSLETSCILGRSPDGPQHARQEVQHRRKDGSLFDIELSCALVAQQPEQLVTSFVRDISERKHNEATLRELSSRLMASQEDERRHIARELHDEIGQLLTTIKVTLPDDTKPEGAHYGTVSRAVDEALARVRNLSLSLHPVLLEDLGLLPALRHHIFQQAERAGLTLSFDADIGDETLPKPLARAVYRIAQEALTNIIRHAQASRVEVTLTRHQGALELTLSDDGVGFDQDDAWQRASLGLRSLVERARQHNGRLYLDTAPGRGTQVRVHFPLEAAALS